MEGQAVLIVFSTNEPEKAAPLYGALLKTEPYVKSPYYVGFKQGAFEIGLAKPDSRRDSRPVLFVDTTHLRERIAELTGAGATLQQDVTDVGGGLQIAVLKDADGNYFGLRQAPA